jgi:glycosyltransferase involved in cell wall biosynthesis
VNVWLIEPYYAGSHRAWAEGYQAHSRHDVQLLTLPGRFWKWRMHGGAVTLARKARARQDHPDLVLASDMLDLSTFMALTSDKLDGRQVPVALYFHENQLTYPPRPGEKRDLHYGFINYVSALCADRVFFNSRYHREAFFEALLRMLKNFPDYNELATVTVLRDRSEVLPLGLDLARFDAQRPDAPYTGRPLVLWNHRWEYDKDPHTFFQAVDVLAAEGLDFGLLLLGRSYRNVPEEFLAARERWPDRIVHFGYVGDAADYARMLWQADVVVSTALHDFFGVAVAEACYCGCFPILPQDLAYPELIPARHHAACLYADFEGLLARLRHAITHVESVRSLSLQQHLAQFDWGHMGVAYDDRLVRCVDEKHTP